MDSDAAETNERALVPQHLGGVLRPWQGYPKKILPSAIPMVRARAAVRIQPEFSEARARATVSDH